MYAVIVGGLNRRDISHSVSRVPWLREWPVLEYLFGSRSDNDSRSTLFVLMNSDPTFPRGAKLGRSRVWLISDLFAWLRNQGKRRN